jgi:hypothetical protein
MGDRPFHFDLTQPTPKGHRLEKVDLGPAGRVLVSKGTHTLPQWDTAATFLAEADIVVGGVYSDEDFTIQHVADTSSQWKVNGSNIPAGTTITSTIPSTGGEILHDTSSQTVSNKAIDSSNTVVKGALPSDTVYETGVQTISEKVIDSTNTVVKQALPLDVVYQDGTQAIFDKTLDESNDVADGALTDNILKRNGASLSRDSLGFGSQVDNTYAVVNWESRDRQSNFLRFLGAGSGSGVDSGWSGIEFNWKSTDRWYLHTRPGGTLVLSRTTGFPNDHQDVGSPRFQFIQGGGVRVYHVGSGFHSHVTPATLTANHTFNLPDKGGTALVEGDVEAVQQSYNDHSVFYYRLQTQSLTSGTSHVILFNALVRDHNGNYNTSTGTYTAPLDGLYSYSFACDLPAGSYNAFIDVTATGLGTIGRTRFNQTNSGGPNSATASLTIPLNANDELRFRVRQDTGGTISLNGGVAATYMSVAYLGPLS